MATIERALPYRGDISALRSLGSTLVFTTVHPEGRPTAVYRIDVDPGELKQDNLPGGASDLVFDDAHTYVAGTDGQVHRGPRGGGALSAIGPQLAPAPKALALVRGDRLAVLSGTELVILSRSGAEAQRLPLGEEGSAIAADPSGAWLVVGSSLGTLIVLEGESRAVFQESERKKVHEGAVTALAFEPNELRVLSTGADNRLFSTHVRGRLEPEDRAGKNTHDAAPRAIAFGTGERVYTAGKDSTIKVWEGGTSKRRPATVKDVPAGVALALTELKGRPQLALAGEDGTIRLLALDAAGKVGDPVKTFSGGQSWARAELGATDPRRREAALNALAAWNDAPSLDLLLARAGEDTDHGLRVLACKLLGETGNVRARAALERLLGARDEAVRRTALAGLRAMEGATALRPLDLALKAQKPDVGVLAVEALVQLSATDDQALSRLVGALDLEPQEVRVAALGGLESVLGAGPAADLQALRSKRPDVRRLALVRCFQRELLSEGTVQAALRRHGEDADADVRTMAFLVSVRSRPKLSDALRALDKDLHRQLHELETFGKPADPEAKLPKTKAVDPATLDEADLAPLLQAMASRMLDTCLRGATGLAVLQDPRALGTLLQLSRDNSAAARVSACKALQALGDTRATQRLRTLVRDAQAEVRDAAFTALSRLLEAEGPLSAASAGLGAEHEDVRRRGLEIGVREIRRTGAAKASKPALDLLARALDDASTAVRREAFKAALNLNVDGGGAGSLRFALRSIHAEVRREVLVEVEGQITEPWAGKLLLDLFGDPDPGIRKEAFEFAGKKAKSSELGWLAAALGCRYPDLRVSAATALAKRHTAGARDLLVKALDDEESAVRRLAVDALVVAEAGDALVAAMQSRFSDVSARAASARAGAGDSAALAPLLAILAQPAPETGDKAPWIERMEIALGGLGALGDPAALNAVGGLLDHAEVRVRKAAARALGPISRPDKLDALRRGLQHADRDIKLEAALGLAFCGDPGGASLLFAAEAPAPQAKGRNTTPPASSVPPDRLLLAAVGLGDLGRDQLLATLDHSDKNTRERALLLALLAEGMEEDGQPDQCIAALSSAFPRARLLAARALEQFGDRDAFAAVVVEVFNDRGEGQAPWTVPAETVRVLATAVTSADPQLRVRAAELLSFRDQPEQEAFDRAWRTFQRRFGPAARPAAHGSRVGAGDIQKLVFGAYVGLARLKGGGAEIRIQQTALARLLAMVGRDNSWSGSVTPVLVQALCDPSQLIRKVAFDGLRGLGMPSTALGAEALANENRDVGALGLQLLSESQGGAAGLAVLEGVLLQRDDGLEEEALRLLLAARDPISPLVAALGARSANLRDTAVAGLANRGAEGIAGLKVALTSRYRAVRFRAAEELATQRDASGYDTLLELLASDQVAEQRRAIAAFARLGDVRAAGALLDRIDRDPAGSAAKDALLDAAGAWRQRSIADRLFGYLTDTKTRAAAGRALVMIAGYDQPILDPKEDGTAHPPADWEARQHPRWDALLARLLDAAWQLADVALVRSLLPGARWARSPVLGESLALLLHFADDRARREAVEALGWRLRKRAGDATALLRALEHADLDTRFIAAEGLALAGRREGVLVMLSSVDALADLDLRRRAVVALGRLGDGRALDTLLRLVETEGHALQEEAAEAIGHLADSPKAAEILALLVKLSAGDNNLSRQALTGLRWYNTAAAWAEIRARVDDDDWTIRQRAAELLGFNDEPASREALATRIAEDDDSDVVRAAYTSLRRLCGPDSLEPDYAAVLSEHAPSDVPFVERLGQRGDALRLLDLLPRVSEDLQESLEQALLAREPLPVDAAAARLEAVDDRTGALAARLLGRAGSGGAAHGAAVEAALGRIRALWGSALDARSGPLEDRQESLTDRLVWLVWTAGRRGVGADAVVSLATPADRSTLARKVRGAALAALAGGLGGESALDALEAAVTGAEAENRAQGAAGLAARAPGRAAALAARVLDDPGSLQRLGGELATLRAGLTSVHTQGVVVSAVVRGGDAQALAAVLADRSLPEAVRLGALEAISKLGTEAAEASLVKVGADAAEDEALRKAAWRALRRSRRVRKSAAVRNEVRA